MNFSLRSAGFCLFITKLSASLFYRPAERVETRMNDDDTGSENESDDGGKRWTDWRNHRGDA